jgi:tyrosyl-tRNA synthetase
VQVFGLTCPLLLNSDGTKMGKTARGAIWLDAARTSPYAFFQYWLNVSDADVLMCLNYLSDLSQPEIADLAETMRTAPEQRAAQKALATNLTRLVHDQSGLASAERASAILFGAEIEALSDAELGDIFADVPSAEAPRAALDAGLGIVDALMLTGLNKSKAEARRALDSGAIYVNNRRVTPELKLQPQSLASESVVVLRSGKKNYALLRFV